MDIVASSKNGYGCIEFGSTNSYDTSTVKIIIDEYVLDKLSDDMLKEVSGYRARLIKIDEYKDIKNSNEWIYFNPQYWTMSQVTNYPNFVRVIRSQDDSNDRIDRSWTDFTVRPVINVYKSAIQKIN